MIPGSFRATSSLQPPNRFNTFQQDNSELSFTALTPELLLEENISLILHQPTSSSTLPSLERNLELMEQTGARWDSGTFSDARFGCLIAEMVTDKANEMYGYSNPIGYLFDGIDGFLLNRKGMVTVILGDYAVDTVNILRDKESLLRLPTKLRDLFRDDDPPVFHMGNTRHKRSRVDAAHRYSDHGAVRTWSPIVTYIISFIVSRSHSAWKKVEEIVVEYCLATMKFALKHVIMGGLTCFVLDALERGEVHKGLTTSWVVDKFVQIG